MQFRRQLQRIERVHELEPSHHRARLVALQVSDQMPARPGETAQLILLPQPFLHTVLTDVWKSRVQRRANGVRAEPLRHRHNRDGVRRQLRNRGPHLIQALGEGLETHSRSI